MEKDKRKRYLRVKTLMICMIFRKFFCEVYGEDTIRLDCAINTDICFQRKRNLINVPYLISIKKYEV